MFHVIFLGFSTKMIFCFFARASNGFTQTSKENDLPVKKEQKHTLPPRCFSAKSLPTSFGAVQFRSCLVDGYGNLRVPPQCRRNKAFPGWHWKGTLKLLWWLQILGIGGNIPLDGSTGWEGVPLLIALLFNELRNDTHKNQHLNWPPFKRKTCGDTVAPAISTSYVRPTPGPITVSTTESTIWTTRKMVLFQRSYPPISSAATRFFAKFSTGSCLSRGSFATYIS